MTNLKGTITIKKPGLNSTESEFLRYLDFALETLRKDFITAWKKRKKKNGT